MRFGIVGCGTIGGLHAAQIAELGPGDGGPGDGAAAELIAVADTDLDRATELATKHDCTPMPVAALFDRADIDAVVICLPSGLHADTAVAALQAGKHVVIEKPIDITLAAADRIIAAEQESGRTVTVIGQRRFEPAYQAVRAAVDAGELGRLTSGSAEVSLWRPQAYYDSGGWRGTWALDGGGALMNQGVHVVDLLLDLLGPVEQVSAYSGLLAHERIEVEDTVAAVLRFTSGAIGRIFATTAAHGIASVRVTVAGDRGHAVLENEVLRSFTVDGAERDTAGTRLGPAAHRAQLEDFIDATTTGRPPLATSVAGRAALATVLAVYESARTGSPITPG